VVAWGAPQHTHLLAALPAARAGGRRSAERARPTAPTPHAHAPASAGKPLFGTLISLLEDGVPILGIIDQPILRERWLGVSGQASTLNGSPIASRACDDVAKAYLYATTPHMFSGARALFCQLAKRPPLGAPAEWAGR